MVNKTTRSRLRYYLLEKQYGPTVLSDLYRIGKRAFIYIMYIYIPVSAIATVTNNVIVKEDRYAAILLSGYAFSDYDYWASPLAFLGSYPAWTLYFNFNGMQTDYIFRATREDLKTVLVDPKYQSIVLVGHGSSNVWRATDSYVTNDDINNWKPLFTPKTGEWIQLSCPASDTYPEHLGELVMDDKEKVYHYSGRTVGNTEFVTDALTGFRLIKYQTHKRRDIKENY
jgi:hypothetical protein